MSDFRSARARLRRSQLKLVPVCIQRVQKGVHAAAMPNGSKAGPVLQRGGQKFLLHPAPAHSLVRNQAIGNFGEGRLNHLLGFD